MDIQSDPVKRLFVRFIDKGLDCKPKKFETFTKNLQSYDSFDLKCCFMLAMLENTYQDEDSEDAGKYMIVNFLEAIKRPDPLAKVQVFIDEVLWWLFENKEDFFLENISLNTANILKGQ